jgi:hypothetical protein
MSLAANNFSTSLFGSSQLMRIAPEPQSSLNSVFSGFGSVATSLIGAGADVLAGADYAALIGAQLQAQREMQVISMVSNVEKSKHETQMAAIRNVRVS